MLFQFVDFLNVCNAVLFVCVWIFGTNRGAMNFMAGVGDLLGVVGLVILEERVEFLKRFLRSLVFFQLKIFGEWDFLLIPWVRLELKLNMEGSLKNSLKVWHHCLRCHKFHQLRTQLMFSDIVEKYQVVDRQFDRTTAPTFVGKSVQKPEKLGPSHFSET